MTKEEQEKVIRRKYRKEKISWMQFFREEINKTRELRYKKYEELNAKMEAEIAEL